MLDSSFMLNTQPRSFANDAFWYGVGVLLIVGFIFNIVQFVRRRSKNYEWYKTEHSGCLKNGKVSCYTCGGTRIHARGLMNHTYTREHFCTQCGTTLYYSPEGKAQKAVITLLLMAYIKKFILAP